MNINIICVGKLKEKYLADACGEYAKRLSAFCKLSVIELTPFRLPDNPNESEIKKALEDEADRIIAKTGQNDAVISLCIEGKEKGSEAFAKEIGDLALSGFSTISFIIGGSHGLSDRVKAMSKIKMSMGPMTFPHQLARVMLLEQIYRAFMINNGNKYHK